MSTPTYEKIQHIELTSAAASIPFTSIPATYTDLKIVLSVRAAGNTIGISPKFNGSTANFSGRFLEGTGSGTSSYTASNIIAYTNSSSFTASTFGNTEIYIPNYASSNAKSISIDSVTENNATTSYQLLGAVLWNNTAAISSIEFVTDNASNFAAGSSATLYGIKSIPSAPKATGGIISYVNGYWVHTFTSSGTFTPSTSLSCDVLVVAGGGGGGVGGGGAGGYRYLTGQTLSTAQTVTIGGGGAFFTNGSNSSIGSISSTGGGRGGTGDSGSRVGGSGGSGGGAGWQSGAAGGTGNAGSYSPSEGNNGGNWNNQGFPAASGGGGGAGAAGSNGTSGGIGGAGGAGTASSITGTSITRAGGGGGAGQTTGGNTSGGAGGGGLGQNGSGAAPTTGEANTGGGGGGGWNNQGVAGGSGIVVVRYQ